eukprot:GHVU01068080.1.p1 GENE.GHVU01068080.1~~GHVU01068080.1.p1  ORF type:complete len:261 (-),score=57.98 GHVU01068080.1:1901-2587(-)
MTMEAKIQEVTEKEAELEKKEKDLEERVDRLAHGIEQLQSRDTDDLKRELQDVKDRGLGLEDTIADMANENKRLAEENQAKIQGLIDKFGELEEKETWLEARQVTLKEKNDFGCTIIARKDFFASLPVVLASTSPRRLDVCHRMGLRNIEVLSSDYEVSADHGRDSPAEYCMAMAQGKTRDVAKRIWDTSSSDRAVVLGGDTVVVDEYGIMEKPSDDLAAYEMLSRLS